MRGEHQRSHPQQLMFSGIIPACAGSTPPQGRRPPRPRDHPRMRGEHIPCAMAFCSRLGSSPHARGAQHADRVGGNASGIIPACAGSTALLSLVVAAGQDHPRMRGEHRASRGGQCGAKGSSPHARGALVYEMCRLNPSGIIPACAGSTRARCGPGPWSGDHPRMRGEHASARPPARRGWDHPRMRGEHENTEHDVMTVQGSSPHARGAHSVYLAARSLGGIIPACAGSTPRACGRSLGSRDHPRMRGEHAANNASRGGVGGSSPHARGALSLQMAEARELGIIPACAGSTRVSARGRAHLGDHPRMRGEHRGADSGRAGWAGSSPHARGAHER